jgi:hypothetical protein
VWERQTFDSVTSGQNYITMETMYISAIQFFKAIEYSHDGIIVEENIDPDDIEQTINNICKLNNLNVSNDDILGATFGTFGTIGGIAVIIMTGGLGTAAAVIIVNSTATTCSILGSAFSLETLFKFIDQYDFSEACRKGSFNISASHQTLCKSKPNWEAWYNYSYINKYSLSDRGNIIPGLSSQQIVDWCQW